MCIIMCIIIAITKPKVGNLEILLKLLHWDEFVVQALVLY